MGLSNEQGFVVTVMNCLLTRSLFTVCGRICAKEQVSY